MAVIIFVMMTSLMATIVMLAIVTLLMMLVMVTLVMVTLVMVMVTVVRVTLVMVTMVMLVMVLKLLLVMVTMVTLVMVKLTMYPVTGASGGATRSPWFRIPTQFVSRDPCHNRCRLPLSWNLSFSPSLSTSNRSSTLSLYCVCVFPCVSLT